MHKTNHNNADKYNYTVKYQNEKAPESSSDTIQENEQIKNTSVRNKIISGIGIALFFYYFIASYLNWPPSNYVSKAIQIIFNEENTIRPLFSAIILTFPTVIILSFVNRLLRKK